MLVATTKSGKKIHVIDAMVRVDGVTLGDSIKLLSKLDAATVAKIKSVSPEATHLIAGKLPVTGDVADRIAAAIKNQLNDPSLIAEAEKYSAIERAEKEHHATIKRGFKTSK